MTSANPNFYVMGLGPGGLPAEEVTVAEKLREAGFTQVWRSHDTFEPLAMGGWSRNMYHSAWQRKPVRRNHPQFVMKHHLKAACSVITRRLGVYPFLVRRRRAFGGEHRYGSDRAKKQDGAARRLSGR